MIALIPIVDESMVREYLARTVSLPDEVDRLLIELGEDWAGNAAVWLWVIVWDEAANNLSLIDSLFRAFNDAIYQSSLNLQPYVSFRTVTEQQEIENGTYDTEDEASA